MALVLIAIQDTPEGSVTVRMDYEPLAIDEIHQTIAQKLGATVLESITNALNKEADSPRIQLLS